MTKKNDERIMQLKATIEQKKQELRKRNNRFVPVTNCILQLDKNIMYNLHVDDNEMILLRLNMLRMSAQDLDMDSSKIMISGYSLDTWIKDVKNNLDVEKYKKEKKKLESLEKQLTALLSDDKQTELQIESLATMIENK